MADRPAPPFERYAQHWLYSDLVWTRPGEILFTSNLTGQFNLWRMAVGQRGERGPAEPLTAYTDRAVRGIVSGRDGRSVFFMADEDGDEQLQIYRTQASGGEPVAVTHDRKVHHELASGALDPTGRRLLYAGNGRDPADMDIVLHDLVRDVTSRPLRTGEVWANPTWDPAGRRFFVHRILSNTRAETHVHDLGRKTTVEVVPHETDEVAMAQAWTRDGKGLLMLTDLGREFAQLELVDVASGKRKVLASPNADVENVQFAPKSSTLLYSVNQEGYSELYAGQLAGRARRLTALPRGALAGGIWGSALALSPDGACGAALWTNGAQPTGLTWFPLARGRSVPLIESMVGGVPDGPLPAPKLVHFPAPDGRQIPALYYRPKRPPKGPAPAVLSIHGGPESQERPAWMYSGLYAWWNANGISVLAPNIRGSTGYGKTYQKLIHHDWGGAELEDLRAAAEWMRAQPEIDPARLGVFGGSFGGFATLSCVTRLAEYWKVGVDLVGPSNLITFVKTVPPFWTRYMDEWVGNPDREADFLRARSPITYIDNVRADLLIIQGANDPRVNKAESDQMVERLRAAGRKVDYMVFENEGHGFTRRENQRKAIGAAARFLAERLRM